MQVHADCRLVGARSLQADTALVAPGQALCDRGVRRETELIHDYARGVQ